MSVAVEIVGGVCVYVCTHTRTRVEGKTETKKMSGLAETNGLTIRASFFFLTSEPFGSLTLKQKGWNLQRYLRRPSQPWNRRGAAGSPGYLLVTGRSKWCTKWKGGLARRKAAWLHRRSGAWGCLWHRLWRTEGSKQGLGERVGQSKVIWQKGELTFEWELGAWHCSQRWSGWYLHAPIWTWKAKGRWMFAQYTLLFQHYLCNVQMLPLTMQNTYM